MKKTAIAFLFSLMICMLFACGSDSSLYRFDGKWEMDTEKAIEILAAEMGFDPQNSFYRNLAEFTIKQEGLDTLRLEVDAKKKRMTLRFRNETVTGPVTAAFYNDNAGALIDRDTKEIILSFTFTGYDTLISTGWSEDNDPVPMRRIIEK